MSIIERAMERLGGAPAGDDGPVAPAPDPAAAAAPGRTEAPAGTAVTEPVVTTKAELPVRAPVPPPAVAPAPSRPPPASPAQIAVPNGAELHLSFDHLASRGFLVPGQSDDMKAEEYQHIKRRLLGNMVAGMMESAMPSNLVMITSSVPSEGKTFTTINLAISIAMEMDRTVLVIDSDIIKSDLTRLFGAQDRLGLFDLLSRDDLTVPDVLIRTNIPKLVLMPAGRIRDVVSEKLASEAMRRLAVELGTRYRDRVVLFDCPPILATSGAVALAPYVGQILMVVEAGKTTHETLRQAVETMSHTTITGLVLNKSKEARAGGGYYGYGYGYHQPNSRAKAD